MVRLKGSVADGAPFVFGAVFQSHCGAIKSPLFIFGAAILLPGFNPTVVRLKVVYLCASPGLILSRFNPTVVRLKAPRETASTSTTSKFQSHCGAIKRGRHARRPMRGGRVFQSHCGAIKSPLFIFGAATLLPGFNPTVVRLKVGPAWGLHWRAARVSIPLWCD